MVRSKLNGCSRAAAYIKFCSMVIVMLTYELTELKVCLHKIYMYLSILDGLLLWAAFNSAFYYHYLCWYLLILLFILAKCTFPTGVSLSQGEGSYHISELKRKSILFKSDLLLWGCPTVIDFAVVLQFMKSALKPWAEPSLWSSSWVITIWQALHMCVCDFMIELCLIHPNPSKGKKNKKTKTIPRVSSAVC